MRGSNVPPAPREEKREKPDVDPTGIVTRIWVWSFTACGLAILFALTYLAVEALVA